LPTRMVQREVETKNAAKNAICSVVVYVLRRKGTRSRYFPPLLKGEGDLTKREKKTGEKHKRNE